VSTPRWNNNNSRPPRLQGLYGHPPANQPIQSDTGSLDPKSPKTSQFSVIRRFIGIESHASDSYYHSYTVATSVANRLASQICHNRLFRKKLQQNILPMISTEVSSFAAPNTPPTGQPNNPTAVKYPYATSGLTAVPARSPRDISYALTTTSGKSSAPTHTNPFRPAFRT
jgi:hypothetical protein